MPVQPNFAGTIPPLAFLSKFVSPGRLLPPCPSADFTTLYGLKSNEAVRANLIRILNNSQLCPGLTFYLPKLKKRQEDALRAECDEDMENNKYGHHIPSYPSIAARQKVARGTTKRKNTSAYYDFGTTVLAVEAAVHPDEDPFTDRSDFEIATASPPLPHPAGEPTNNIMLQRRTLKASIVRARLIKSAQALFLRQHRTRLLQLVLVSGGARFLVFDRAGVIVSQRFDYLKNPDILANFFWRFAHMTDAARGQDPSAVPATRQQVSSFTEAIHGFASVDGGKRAFPNARQSLDSLGLFPVWTIRVANGSSGDTTQLVTQKPFSEPSSLCCRGTRAYLAYDLKAQRLVFFKDSWRENDIRVRPEFDIYQDLRGSDVPFVPGVLYGGDVLDPDGTSQQTVVDEAYGGNTAWRLADDPPRGRIHHRLVQNIHYPLESVRDERELIQALHDAVLAIDKTHTALGTLHRDVSSNNVMLDLQGRCMLGDWDHAGRSEPDVGAIGTAPFMSIRLLRDDMAHNELVDDLQSIFWVLNHVAIVRFAQHYHGLNVGIFDSGPPAEYLALGTDKLMAMSRRALYEGRYRSAALTWLIRDLAESWTRFTYHEFEPPEPSAGDDAEPNMLELAPQPQYWLQKFAEALRQCDAENGAPRSANASKNAIRAAQDSDGSPTVCAGTKRKDLSVAPVSADEERPLVRRSKRLRIMRQRI